MGQGESAPERKRKERSLDSSRNGMARSRRNAVGNTRDYDGGRDGSRDGSRDGRSDDGRDGGGITGALSQYFTRINDEEERDFPSPSGESADYRQSGSKDFEMDSEAAAKCANKRDLERPRRTLSPFNCFVHSQTTESTEKQSNDGGREVDFKHMWDRWRSLSDSEKRPYCRQSAADKQRYARDKKIYDSAKDKIIRRPRNGFIIFMKRFRQQNRRQYPDPKQLTREGARAWRRLSPKEKEPYNYESLNESLKYADERLKWCNKVVAPRRNDTRRGGPPDEAMDEEFGEDEMFEEEDRNEKKRQTQC